MTEKMTMQFKILTGMKARYTKEGFLNVNPFCGATKDKILENFEWAKEVYADVFKQFISTWYQHFKNELPCPPKEWETLEV